MPKCKQILFGAFGLVFLGLAGARAQEEPAVELDAIVITAPREDSRRGTAPEGPSTALKIGRAAPLSDSASDIAGRVAGVHVTDHGGLEAATSVSIRGSSRSQVAVFLDGIPLESASGGGVNLSEVNANGLSAIEIYKSFTPSDFGTSSIGGVINLKSRPIRKGWHHEYDLGGGSFSTFFAGAQASFGGEKGDVLLRADYRRTSGDFTFLDDNGTPLNFGDDRRTRRSNNEMGSVHPYLKWIYRFDERSRVEAVTHFFRTDAGVPGLMNFQSVTAKRSLTEWMGSVAFSRKDCWGGKGEWRNTVYGRFIRSQFSDPNGEIGLGAGQDNDERTTIFGDRWKAVAVLTDAFSFQAGIEYAAEAYIPRDSLAARPIGSTSTRQQANVWGEPKLSLLNGKLKLLGQTQLVNAFYDINNDDPSLFAPGTYFSARDEHPVAGTLATVFSAPAGFTFKASAGRAVRLPKFSELFGDQGTVLGNPQLQSEKSLKFDGGVLWRGDFGAVFKDVVVEAGYFESRVNDLIQFELASGLVRAANVGRGRMRGVEALISAKLMHGFSLSQNYTWQRAVDLSVNRGNFLVGRAEHESNTEVAFARGPFKTAVRLNFVDNQFLDALNTRKVDARARIDAEASYGLGKRVTLGAEAKNVTGTQIVDAVGFPLPGRSFFGRVSASF